MKDDRRRNPARAVLRDWARGLLPLTPWAEGLDPVVWFLWSSLSWISGFVGAVNWHEVFGPKLVIASFLLLPIFALWRVACHYRARMEGAEDKLNDMMLKPDVMHALFIKECDELVILARETPVNTACPDLVYRYMALSKRVNPAFIDREFAAEIKWMMEESDLSKFILDREKLDFLEKAVSKHRVTVKEQHMRLGYEPANRRASHTS